MVIWRGGTGAMVGFNPARRCCTAYPTARFKLIVNMKGFSAVNILFVIGVAFGAPRIDPPTTPTPTTVKPTDDSVIIEPVNPAEARCATCRFCESLPPKENSADFRCFLDLFVCDDHCCEGF
ncbi:hypothetical protein FOZ63_031868 [Perkinsus olseni]|uniref:Uncharacterized protein n=1 Tax=Perkinsus olseni TaxID=32597 RepID=A0A7J6QB41_PEROL|nr:hypothetical protein FOZ63_031868 [Perkinsus olseni]KAF4713387.1 hypothetical protein FOZ62_006438 [Perkinsus olseni]